MRRVRIYVSPEFRELVNHISSESGLAPYLVTKVIAKIIENRDELRNEVKEVVEKCRCDL